MICQRFRDVVMQRVRPGRGLTPAGGTRGIPSGSLAVQNFGKLVLGCTEADFATEDYFLQHSPRSTRFARLCTPLTTDFANVRQTSW